VTPARIATSVLQQQLRQNKISAGVYNLGHHGYDPYESLYRLRFFKSHGLSPDCVILVVESDYNGWFNRHTQPLDFTPGKKFGQVNTSPSYSLQRQLRNHSALINLLVRKDNFFPIENDFEEDNVVAESTVSESMRQTLRMFHEECPAFMLVSMSPDKHFNQQLDEFCANNGIVFFKKGIKIPVNRIDGSGHLNEKGNRELGEFLYRSLLSTFPLAPESP